MKERKYGLFTLLVFMLFTTGCSKDDCSDCFEEKVSCYVNGEYWEDCCDNCGSIFGGRGHTDCAYRAGSTNIIFHAGNNCSSNRNGLVHLGSVSLIGDGHLEYNSTWYNESANSCQRSKYFLDTLNLNYIQVDFYDKEKEIIEGRFAYSAQDECGNKVEITDGQFALKFRLP